MITLARRVASARTARLVVGGVALACTAMLVTACGGSPESTQRVGSSATPAASDPPASGTAASSAPAASPTPPAPASPSPGVAGTWSGYSPCRNLQVTLGLAQRDPTVTYQVIDFTNRGSRTCVIYGYPGVSLAAGIPPVPIGLPAAHNPSAPPKVVTLTPGGVVNALLQIHGAQGTCGPVQARYLIVYRPNGLSPVKLAFAATACAKRVQIMQISAVSLGTGG